LAAVRVDVAADQLFRPCTERCSTTVAPAIRTLVWYRHKVPVSRACAPYEP
jgi:hypothetical protein